LKTASGTSIKQSPLFSTLENSFLQYFHSPERRAEEREGEEGEEKENFQLAKLHSSKKKIKISFHSLGIILIWFDSKNNGEHDGDKGGERL